MIERRLGDPQGARGAGLVPARPFHGLNDHLLLDLGQRLPRVGPAGASQAAPFSDLLAQVPRREPVGPQGRQPARLVLELAHVPRPGVARQQLHRLARDVELAPPAALGLEEVAQEGRNVLGSLAQGRHVEAQDVEAVVEVEPELALLGHGPQVAVGRRHHPAVGADRLVAADRAHLPLLQHAQQLALHHAAHVPDLVEEERPLAGHHEQTLVVLGRAREAASPVPEELALEQAVRDRRAVLGQEGLAVVDPAGVDLLGDQLLAGAALAGDQHRRVAARRPLDLPVELLHDLRAADQRAEARRRVLGQDQVVGLVGRRRARGLLLELLELFERLVESGLARAARVVELRGLEREGRLVGEGLHHRQIRQGEGVGVEAVVEVEHAHRLAAQDHGHREDREHPARLNAADLTNVGVRLAGRDDPALLLEHTLDHGPRHLALGPRQALLGEAARDVDLDLGLAARPLGHADQEAALRVRQLDGRVEDHGDQGLDVALGRQQMREISQAPQPLHLTFIHGEHDRVKVRPIPRALGPNSPQRDPFATGRARLARLRSSRRAARRPARRDPRRRRGVALRRPRTCGARSRGRARRPRPGPRSSGSRPPSRRRRAAPQQPPPPRAGSRPGGG